MRHLLIPFLLASSTAFAAADPPLEICDGTDMINIAPPGTDYVQMRCENTCIGSFESCSEEDTPTDVFGRPLRILTFTVDGMVGRVRYNDPDPQLGIKAGVFVHPGGQGTDWIDTNREFWGGLERDGLRVVAVRWYPGVIDPITGSSWGWLSKKSFTDGGYYDSTVRPAAVMSWVHQFLIPSDVPFGAIGHSNGGLAVVGALYWHGVEDKLDYLMLNSPSAKWDLAATCATASGILPEFGICEHDPAVDCQTDADCGGARDKCAYPKMEPNQTRRMDYRLGSGDACQTAQPHPMLDANGIGTSPGDAQWPFPVDVVVSEGRTRRPEAGDTLRGATWHAANVFRKIESTHPLGKRWIDHDGYAHGHGATHPDCLPYFECALRRGLNLEPLCVFTPRPPSP